MIYFPACCWPLYLSILHFAGQFKVHTQANIYLYTAVSDGYLKRIVANAHARLHTIAVRESAALHSGKELYTHSRVFPAGSAPRAFPHMLPSLRRKGPRYLIIYLFSAVYYALFIALCCDHRYVVDDVWDTAVVHIYNEIVFDCAIAKM